MPSAVEDFLALQNSPISALQGSGGTPPTPLGPAQQGVPPDASAGLQTGPAATPEEHEARKSGWRNFITGIGDKFQNDPQFRSFMFTLGTRLMQPVPPGQTDLGHLGASLQGAQNYTAALGRARGQGARDTARLGLEERRVATGERAQETAASRTESQNRTDRIRAQAALARAQQSLAGSGAAAFAKDMNRTTFISRAMETFFPSEEAETPELESEERAEFARQAGELWDQENKGRAGADPGTGAAAEPELVQQAREALAQGADPAQVRQILQDNGVDPADWEL